MIYVIAGQPRSGKSQYAVSLIFNVVEANNKLQKKIDAGKELAEGEKIRPIYSDIDGLNIEGVLEAPADWREVPDDAVIFYDEVHFRDEYLDQSKYMTQNPMIKELSVHGHRNIDIYLITQDPRRLEKSIRALVTKLYLAKRPANMPPFCNIYTFDRWLGDPWAASKNPDNVHDTKLFHYKKKYQQAYKSASAHTSVSFKLQRKFIYAIVALVCMISLSVGLFKISGSGKIINDAMHANDIRKDTEITADKLLQQTPVKPQINDPLTPEQRADLTARQTSTTQNQTSTASMEVTYDPNKPFDNQYSAGGSNRPYLSGCIQLKTKCSCYTQQGSKLDVSIADCKKVINEGMPFNPFLAQSAPAPVQSPPVAIPSV